MVMMAPRIDLNLAAESTFFILIFLCFVSLEVEVVEVKNGIMMAREQKRSIPSMIIFHVQNFWLRGKLCKKASLLAGDIVLEDCWLLQLLMLVLIYFEQQF